MNAIYLQQTIGEIVTQNPNLSRVFEAMAIDYCCGGKKTLVEACHQKRLDPRKVLCKLREANHVAAPCNLQVDVTTMSLSELVDHIEKTHHSYLHEELPRLAAMTKKVADRHGERDPRLQEVQDTFRAMALE